MRTAFFPDSYLEVNGAAMTSNRLTEYARKQGYPMLCVYAGKSADIREDGSVKYVQLKRSALSFKLDEDLAYDPAFQRHTSKVLKHLLEFQPDVIHITGLNDVSIVGAYLGWKLQIPIVGSWHTNIHEFAATRLAGFFRFLPRKAVSKILRFAEDSIMKGAVLYYKMPKVVLAPNRELIDRLARGTGRQSFLMGRGVDTEVFSPNKRTVNDGVFRLGSVGRLRPEKNVRRLVEIEKAMLERGLDNFEFLVVGEGSEREYLERKLKNAKFTGFLSGDELAEAYANMDVFLFPSETDAFGNVAQEAMASGVPAIVSDIGGPKFIVDPGKTGFVASSVGEFVNAIEKLMREPQILAEMRVAARESAQERSWDSVFEKVYEAYETAYKIAVEKETRKRAQENADD